MAAMAFMGVCIGAVTDKMINMYQDSIQEEAASVVLAEKFVLKLLEDTFEAADADKDGTLDRAELMSLPFIFRVRLRSQLEIRNPVEVEITNSFQIMFFLKRTPLFVR